ncbi:MAG TPA: DUF3800 domain-containing protein [Anaerolineae bacterium]|nr:DUF3800 domain-containing protein [Anaerolineae bacterium]HQH38227.1 DUF3800 domain-containing protein [Anaerolineae bacterium]
MYTMYADESGDCGMVNSPTRFFVLSGLVIHELRWQDYLDRLINFRKQMQQTFGLRMREEIHGSVMINRPGPLVRIKRNDRLTILRAFADELSTMPYLNVINIVVDKQEKPVNYDVFDMAWRVLIQRFENTIAHHNFRGPMNSDEKGMIFPDNTDNKKLSQLLRKMRRYNPVNNQPAYGSGYRNLRINTVLEDPNFRDSATSYFIQGVDLIAFLLYQKLDPSSYMRKKAGHNYFDRLDPILCKVASSCDPQGVLGI